MTTYSQTKEDALKNRGWRVVDAKDQTLGRLATEIATVIRGKNKPTYTPHVDGGDFVIVLNAERICLTGNKMSQKTYYHHTGYIGGLNEVPVKRMLEEHPERVIQKAVYGMLPKGKLGRQMRKKLKVYAGSEHPHSAQKPEILEIN